MDGGSQAERGGPAGHGAVHATGRGTRQGAEHAGGAVGGWMGRWDHRRSGGGLEGTRQGGQAALHAGVPCLFTGLLALAGL